MKKSIKKGFTLIELMIVLAIIAILAVVLIPKAGAMKDNAKNSGVLTNVNNVRGVLEAKTSDTNYINSPANVITLLNSNFGTSGNTPMQNPFTKQTTVTATAVATTALTTDYASTTNNNNIVVVDGTASNTPAATSSITAVTSTSGYNKGVVFVFVYKDGFAVEGIDASGNVVNAQLLK